MKNRTGDDRPHRLFSQFIALRFCLWLDKSKTGKSFFLLVVERAMLVMRRLAVGRPEFDPRFCTRGRFLPLR